MLNIGLCTLGTILEPQMYVTSLAVHLRQGSLGVPEHRALLIRFTSSFWAMVAWADVFVCTCVHQDVIPWVSLCTDGLFHSQRHLVVVTMHVAVVNKVCVADVKRLVTRAVTNT